MNNFEPNYMNIVNAAKNVTPERLPLYEHNINVDFMEKYYGKEFAYLMSGDYCDKLKFMEIYIGFFKEMGYDTVSFEGCIGPIMPGSGALGGHQPGVVKNRQDFESYPWDQVPDLYFEAYEDYYKALRERMPEGSD